MPGSTSAPSEEQTKAKVTESPATNGIFVRPVAVAGIFRPADDKPPALPEKRRFSAACGELRPSRGVSSDEFARRRQSFDAKPKEVPFGQALLKKTPKQNTLSNSSLSSKPDLTNGSSHEDISCKESSSQIPPAKSVEKLNSKSESLTTLNALVSEKQIVATNDTSKIEKSQIVSNISDQNSKFTNQLDAKNKNIVNATTASIDKSAKDSNSVKNTFKTVITSKSETKNTVSDPAYKISSSPDNANQPKKVFGLMKRESKGETALLKIGSSFKVSELKSDSISTNVEGEFSKNESNAKVIVNSENVNNADSSKSKVKVYGLSKSYIKKEVSKNENNIEIQTSKSLELSSTSIASKNVAADTTVINKSPKVLIHNKAPENKAIKNQSESTDKLKNSASNSKFEANVLSKTTDSKTIHQLSESNVTDSSNLNEVSSMTSDGVSSKTSDSKVSSCVNKISEKISEFQKAQSPPKDFRTFRRTSDVIAAKIQNIFSNVSTPEKPPPIFPKKFKISDRSGSDKESVKTADDKNIITGKLDQTLKQSNEKQTADSNKSEIKMPVESKPVTVEAKNVSKVTTEVVSVTQEDVNTRSYGKGTNNEFKYKEQTLSVADHSSLKKENKLTSESSDVSQCRKVGELAVTRGVAAKTSLVKAGSKIEHTENAAPSKTLDKKILNIGGKMPIKKQDENSSDGTASLKATNRDDRKSSDPTVPRKISFDSSNKETILKVESGNTCVGSSGKDPKIIFSTNSGSSSIESKINTTDQNIGNSSSIKDSLIKTADVSLDKSSILHTESVALSSGITVHSDELHKDSKNSVNSSNASTNNQISKIEVAKITPCTTSSVPTVNVHFRTKSSQSTTTKEENRKKVIVESYSGSSNSLINSTKISNDTSSTCESVQEALKTVENVQKSLNSAKLSSRHSIVNLKKEELASVDLSIADSSLDNNNNMPPNVAKVTDKCSSIDVNGSKIETASNFDTAEVSTPAVSDVNKTKLLDTVASYTTDYGIRGNSAAAETSSNVETNNTIEKVSVGEIGALGTSVSDKTFQIDKTFISDIKSNVVDLNDWGKKFQCADPEPPRVPFRRRAARESMPPSIPIRSRFGSLKRLDDSPSKYIARSPSQSCIPQRYSYTEMLSKVCSMGVLPFTEPLTPRSCSSSSSQVSELWSELSEEQATATHTSEMLEAETTERMRLEKEVQELQNRCSQVQLRSDKMEMEMMEARVYRTSEINGDLSEDEDAEANSSLYKQKYERAVRDMEIMKRRMQQQHEEEVEQKAMLKKASDKRLAEALEDVEEERQVANQWKRKAQKLGSELQDLRLMLEEQMARNGELEKKQRRFDAELSAAQEEIKKERLLREKFTREKDHAVHEKYSLEQDLQSAKLDIDTLHEKIAQLNRELDELTLSSKGEEEVTQLKRAKQELERKSRDQEEELEELAAQVSMLEQAKLRLEMSLEKVRQEHRREASVREEEIEEIRASFSKKIKNLEAQLETEQDERHQLMKQKHELERRLYEMADQPPPQDPEIERRLRRDLKRTKALLRDAQSMLEHTREGQSGKTLIRQLKNQLEDSEFAKATAVKARQAVEAELHDCQSQLEEATRAKNEAESRCLQLSREKSAIQTQLEEAEEEMAEVMKKYKAAVSQMSIDQKTISEQNQQIADLETEKQMLKDQLSEVSHKFEHLAGQSEDTHKVHRLDGKVRDLESKLELELTTRSRLEHQIARLKEQNERIREECDSLRNKELQAQEGVRRLQRQMRDLREDYSALQQKEAEAYRKQHELEMALENTETDLQVTKNDLRLACQRIQDLQSALEDDLDSGTDVPDDSGSDSDDSFELSVLRNQSVTPTQRCDSAGSNYSLASEGFRSRTSSFTHELSAFSRMMMFNRQKTSMDFLG